MDKRQINQTKKESFEEVKVNDDCVNQYFSEMVNFWTKDIGRTNYISKIKDYKLIHAGDIEGKIVLNCGPFFPIDEILFSSFANKWCAVDNSVNVINGINKIVTFLKLSKVETNLCDLRKLTYKDNYFDIILSFSTIDHIQDESGRLASIKEIYRVLKPGGIFIITVPSKQRLGGQKYHPGSTYHSFTKEECYKIFNKFKIIQEICDESDRYAFRLMK